ncbi:hypothetical protein T484DRAFT_1874337, partial [Baffinella frigidus]
MPLQAGIFNNSRRSKFVARPKALAKAARKQEGGGGLFSEKDFFRDCAGAEKRAHGQADTPQLHPDPRAEEVSGEAPSAVSNFHAAAQQASPPPQPASSLQRLLSLAPSVHHTSDVPAESAPERRTSAPSLAQKDMAVLEAAAAELLPKAAAVDARPLQVPHASADLDEEVEDGITSRKRRLQEIVGVIRPDDRYAEEQAYAEEEASRSYETCRVISEFARMNKVRLEDLEPHYQQRFNAALKSASEAFQRLHEWSCERSPSSVEETPPVQVSGRLPASTCRTEP